MALIDQNSQGQRIDNYLLTQLKGVPRSHIYQLLRSGQVRVNKGRIKPPYRLKLGDEVRIPPVRIAEKSASTVPTAVLKLLEQYVVFMLTWSRSCWRPERTVALQMQQMTVTMAFAGHAPGPRRRTLSTEERCGGRAPNARRGDLEGDPQCGRRHPATRKVCHESCTGTGCHVPDRSEGRGFPLTTPASPQGVPPSGEATFWPLPGRGC